MRILYSVITALAFFVTTNTDANATTNIFACEPEWASLAKEIGGDKVTIFAATNANQDPHHIRATPGLIAAIRKADIVICSGASLEIGWLPILLQSAKKDVQPGNIGFLQAADILPILEKPTSLDRSNGDIHPEGNPHLHLNPHNIAIIARELSRRLAQVDSGDASYYQTRYTDFAKKWEEAIRRWESEASSLKGMEVIAHHKSLTYLESWLGLNEVGTLEPKPGIAPTSKHLEGLLQATKVNQVRVIIRASYEPDNASNWLSEKTNIPALKLPYTIGGNEQSKDLFSLFDSTIATLKRAHSDK